MNRQCIIDCQIVTGKILKIQSAKNIRLEFKIKFMLSCWALSFTTHLIPNLICFRLCGVLNDGFLKMATFILIYLS